jgi:glycosyltransferase involved in cell wall biosynthesis
MKVACVHDWLTGMRGGEKVLEAILELFPQADLFTLLHVPGSVSPAIERHRIHTSPLQRVPGAARRYRHFLPLMPSWIERFDLSTYDLVLSSSHCVAKGARKAPHALHVSYVHAPMRYMWDRFDDYFGPGRASLPVRAAARTLRPWFRRWDRSVSTPRRVDRLIANSRFIAEEILRNYDRTADVLYPFAQLERFKRPREPRDFYLVFGALAPYKRVDLAIEVFRELKLPLKILGSGQDEERLRALAAGTSIEFVPHPSDADVESALAQCRALVFPGKEDFGITPVEALASGAPVIAFAEGGALDTVTDEVGVLFRPQTAEALKAAVLRIEGGEVPSEETCRKSAQRFSRTAFQTGYRAIVEDAFKKARKPLTL